MGQVFASIGQQIGSEFTSNPPVAGPGQQPQNTVVSDLNSALAAYQPQVTNTATSDSLATFTGAGVGKHPSRPSRAALELGLPGLQSFAVTIGNQPVNVQLTFQLDLFFRAR